MGYGEQRDQMLTKEDVTLNCDMDFVYIDDATIDAAWLINPYPAEMNLHYNGKDHKVQVYFFVNATNSMGAIGTVTNKDGVKKKQIQMWVTAAAIYADEKQTSWLNSYVQGASAKRLPPVLYIRNYRAFASCPAFSSRRNACGDFARTKTDSARCCFCRLGECEVNENTFCILHLIPNNLCVCSDNLHCG